MRHLIQKISLHTIQIMSITILLLLTTISLVCSCHIDTNEHVYYTYLTPWNILVYLSVLSLLFFLFQKRLRLPIPKVGFLLAISFLVGLIFVLATHFVPKADQYVCFTIANQMHKNDFSAFAPNAYMQIYPQQIGIVLFYYYLGYVTGPSNVIAIQILNVFCYVCFLYYTYKITLRLFHSRKLACCSLILALLFLPLLVYTSFVYGTMPGLALSSFAIKKAMDYMRSHTLKDILLCATFCSIAVLLKKNYLIVMTAILLVVTVHNLTINIRKLLLFLLLPIAFTLLLTKGSHALCEHITHESIGNGMPSIAWVTMGLQESYRANGWYNSYSLKTYQSLNGDAAATTKIAKKDLQSRLQEFCADKGMAVRFFVGKLSSEWNDSSFQCLIINNIKMITSKNSPLLHSLIDHCGHPFLLAYLDILLELIYFGILLYLIVERKHITLESLIPFVAFLGGFLFHLAWEAKSQYTIGYFVLLFPYCIKGYYSWFARISFAYRSRIHRNIETSHAVTAFSWISAVIPAICLSLILFGYGFLATKPKLHSVITLSNHEYAAFLATVPFEPPELNGNYRLKTPTRSEYVNFTSKIALTKHKYNTEILHVSQDPSATNVCLAKQSVDLNNYQLPVTGRLPNQLPDVYQVVRTTTWKLEPLPDNTCLLTNSKNYALTRTKDHRIVLSPCNSRDSNQKWILEGV